MSGWAEDREYEALELDHARQQAELVACPECGAVVGERCSNVHDGQPLGRLPAHWRRLKAAEGSES